jgi:quercetin dioxygenase-like cupin family protein
MPLYDWSAIPVEKLNENITRQAVHTGNMTIARLGIRQGGVVPEHHHTNVQISMVEAGALRFIMEGQETVVKAGQMMHILPDVPHSVVALEDSVAVDLFTPQREDWIRGDDAYLRR